MAILRVLAACLVKAEGLGATQKVAAPTPSPSSPALVNSSRRPVTISLGTMPKTRGVSIAKGDPARVDGERTGLVDLQVSGVPHTVGATYARRAR